MTRSQRSSISVADSREGRETRELRLTELHEVCASGDEDSLEEMLKSSKYDAMINYKDPDWCDRTPLHWCCLKGRGEMARKLLEKGAHPGLRSDTGWTAAHFAAEIGKTHILRQLHNIHAPMDRQDLFGDTPRRIAEVYDHKETAEFLKIAEAEYRERRLTNEINGEAEPYDDEDVDWCIRNNILSRSDIISSSSVTDSSSLKNSSTGSRRKHRSSLSSSGRLSTSDAAEKSSKPRHPRVEDIKDKSFRKKRNDKNLVVESLHSIAEVNSPQPT